MQPNIKDLINTLPQVGSVQWIGLRPGKKLPMLSVESVQADTDKGLIGDRYNSKNGKRQVTLMQIEHLSVIESFIPLIEIKPDLFRRNIFISGINLLALKDKQFSLGEVKLQMTGLCHPCSYMELILGAGGYNALRGHGGITARVIKNGTIKISDLLTYRP